MNESNNKPFVIGVAGGSGSGKSTVTREVLASIGPEMAAVVMQDDYYLDQSHLSPEERRKTNYDHPDAFDWPLMVQHVQALRRGEAIEMPTYDFVQDNRASETSHGRDGNAVGLRDRSKRPLLPGVSKLVSKFSKGSAAVMNGTPEERCGTQRFQP